MAQHIYHSIPLPYISKSRYTLYHSCPYKFKLIEIDGLTQETTLPMRLGTKLHSLYEQFHGWVDYEYMYQLEYRVAGRDIYNPVYNYFFTLFMQHVPVKNKDFIKKIENFCLFQSDYWMRICLYTRNKHDRLRMFKPLLGYVEKFFRDDENQLYGTLDVIYKEQNKVILLDYKTGMIPGALKREGNVSYSTKLSSKYMQEGVIQGILYLSNIGYKLKKDDKGEWHFYNGLGYVSDNIIKSVDYAYLFTGELRRTEPSYIFARKRIKMLSVRNVMKKIEKMRGDTIYEKVLNAYVCRYCSFFESHCKEGADFEISRDIREYTHSP